MNHFFKDPQTVLHMREGPLGQYIDSYAAEIRAEGYAHGTSVVQIRLVADFSRWMFKHWIKAQEITAEQVECYLRSREHDRCPGRGDHAALRRLLKLLLRQGVIPEPPLPASTPLIQLQEEFRVYLRQERVLASTTVSGYMSYIGEFLAECFGTGPVDLSSLCAAGVAGFVQRRAASIHSRRVQVMTTALRSFLRFARYRGDLNADLAACVPSVANWSLSTVPRDLPAKQVELVLASCNRQTAVGRRDFAILLLLARLGLRAGEVAALTLEDLDWHAGSITVCGKAGRRSQLPLPVDVGEAIVDYLRNGRPRASSRCVFLRERAPARGFRGHEAVGAVVKYALARAGIHSPRKGAHQLRHSLACQMLRQGASLEEIGEILRHRSTELVPSPTKFRGLLSSEPDAPGIGEGHTGTSPDPIGGHWAGCFHAGSRRTPSSLRAPRRIKASSARFHPTHGLCSCAAQLTVTAAAPVKRGKRPCQPTTRGESSPKTLAQEPQKAVDSAR